MSERRYGVSWEPVVRRLMGADPGHRGQRVEGEDCPKGEDVIGRLSDGLWATAPRADGAQELADVVLLRGQTDLAERFRAAGWPRAECRATRMCKAARGAVVNMRTGYMQEQWSRTPRPRQERCPDGPQGFEGNTYWWEGLDRSQERPMAVPEGAEADRPVHVVRHRAGDARPPAPPVCRSRLAGLPVGRIAAELPVSKQRPSALLDRKLRAMVMVTAWGAGQGRVEPGRCAMCAAMEVRPARGPRRMIEGRAYCDKCASLLPSRGSRKELEGLLLLGVAVRAGASAWEGTRLCRTRTAWTRWREWRYHEGAGLDPAQWWYRAILYTVGRVCTEEQWQEWWEGEATRRDALTRYCRDPLPTTGGTDPVWVVGRRQWARWAEAEAEQGRATTAAAAAARAQRREERDLRAQTRQEVAATRRADKARRRLERDRAAAEAAVAKRVVREERRARELEQQRVAELRREERRAAKALGTDGGDPPAGRPARNSRKVRRGTGGRQTPPTLPEGRRGWTTIGITMRECVCTGLRLGGAEDSSGSSRSRELYGSGRCGSTGCAGPQCKRR